MMHPTSHDTPQLARLPARRLAMAIVALCSSGASAQVELRGGAWVDDAVVEVSFAGVRVASQDSSSRVLGWHEVKRVAGERETEANAFRALSDDVWRAWMRLQRGDYELSEPIFERLWKDASEPAGPDRATPALALEGPTGLVIAEGVARVRVWRGALPSAVEPWAASVALRRQVAGDASASIALLDPQLPPVFIHSRAAERLASTEPIAPVREDAVASALFDLYRWAASRSFSQDAPAPAIEDAASAHPDVELVRRLVIAQHGSGPELSRAVEWLQGLARSQPGSWQEAWARFGVGAAAMRSADERERLLGVVQALHVPARFSATQRYLAGHALAYAAIELRRRGEESRAATLRAELERASPAHPAIAWMDRVSTERAP